MKSLGAPVSAELFDDPGWTRTTATAIGDSPYPGYRPTGSWTLAADGTLRSGRADVSPGRLVLAYGSNANPNKLLAHPELFDDGDVVALRAAIFGWRRPGATADARPTVWSWRRWCPRPDASRCTCCWR